MKVLWTMVKVVAAVALVIPLGLLMLGLLGTMFGLAFALARMALVALLAYGAFKLVVRLLGGKNRRIDPRAVPSLPAADPYYEAAMRELDQALPATRPLR